MSYQQQNLSFSGTKSHLKHRRVKQTSQLNQSYTAGGGARGHSTKISTNNPDVINPYLSQEALGNLVTTTTTTALITPNSAGRKIANRAKRMRNHLTSSTVTSNNNNSRTEKQYLNMMTLQRGGGGSSNIYQDNEDYLMPSPYRRSVN